VMCAPVYPWSGVVGQDDLKRALLLCAIDPGIGGVLIQGPRGVAKTTLARALCELIEGSFVELPLGATEERVTGTLDLESVLRDQTLKFSPGLLARAHGGALYVDEINLLSDALVDVLLDAAATGRNVVERDGVSHTHPARFVLVGTMNPDEGELRPQLLDRFGLCVHAQGELLPQQRVQIIEKRLAFDRDPEAFVARFAQQQRELAARCADARARLASIAFDADTLLRVSECCYAARVEGVRADLAMLRAARAHAAWEGRSAISSDDVDAVEKLALDHRRKNTEKTPPPAPPQGQGPSGSGAPSAGVSNRNTDTIRNTRAGTGSTQSSTRGSSSLDGHDGQRGALAPVPVRAAAAPDLPRSIASLESHNAADTAQRRGRARRTEHSASHGLRSRELHARGSVDWFATLSRHPRPSSYAQLVLRAKRGPAAQLWVLMLDCSTSMLRSGALAYAKGVAFAFDRRAARLGAHVAVVGFRGDVAETRVTSRAGRLVLQHEIAALGAGGGTPLQAAFLEAQRLSRSARYKSRDIAKRLVLLTDGRTRELTTNLCRGDGHELIVVDCERGPVLLGGARKIASALGGSYVRI